MRLFTSVDSTKQFTSGIFTQREILYCPYLAWIPFANITRYVRLYLTKNLIDIHCKLTSMSQYPYLWSILGYILD